MLKCTWDGMRKKFHQNPAANKSPNNTTPFIMLSGFSTSPQSQLVSLGGLGLSQLFNVADGGTSGRRGKLQLMYKVELNLGRVENGRFPKIRRYSYH